MVSVTLKTSSGSISALMVSSSVTSSFTGKARSTLHPKPDRRSFMRTQALTTYRRSLALMPLSICGSNCVRKKTATMRKHSMTIRGGLQSEERGGIDANIQRRQPDQQEGEEADALSGTIHCLLRQSGPQISLVTRAACGHWQLQKSNLRLQLLAMHCLTGKACRIWRLLSRECNTRAANKVHTNISLVQQTVPSFCQCLLQARPPACSY